MTRKAACTGRRPFPYPTGFPRHIHLQHKHHRAVVGTHDIRENLRLLNTVGSELRDQEVVQTPSGVLLSGLKAVRPPGILYRIRMQKAERIRKATGQKLLELCPLLRRESSVLYVRLRILDIHLRRRHVQITAENHRNRRTVRKRLPALQLF